MARRSAAVSPGFPAFSGVRAGRAGLHFPAMGAVASDGAAVERADASAPLPEASEESGAGEQPSAGSRRARTAMPREIRRSKERAAGEADGPSKDGRRRRPRARLVGPTLDVRRIVRAVVDDLSRGQHLAALDHDLDGEAVRDARG